MQKQEDGKNKCVYLIDEILGIKEIGQVSRGIIELVAQNISEVSYRVCAEMINNMTGLSISGIAVCNIVQKLGKEIKQYEKGKVEAHQKEKLKGYSKKTGLKYRNMRRQESNNNICKWKLHRHNKKFKNANIVRKFYRKIYSRNRKNIKEIKKNKVKAKEGIYIQVRKHRRISNLKENSRK